MRRPASGRKRSYSAPRLRFASVDNMTAVLMTAPARPTSASTKKRAASAQNTRPRALLISAAASSAVELNSRLCQRDRSQLSLSGFGSTSVTLDAT